MTYEIAFDESGNTGADLLNPQQPVFSLASVAISRVEADELLDTIRTPQTKELKYSRLKRNSAGRGRILSLLSSSKLTKKNARMTFFHKRFMVVTKVVDILVETLAHEDGIDLYKDGANIALSHLHFYCMPAFCGEGRTKTFLRRFVDMIRRRTPETIQQFYRAARALYEHSSDREYAESLAPILLSERMIPFILANNDKNSLDPAIPAFVQHCAFWGEHFGTEFDLVHDDSKPIFQEKKMLEDLMSRGEEEQMIGYDRRKFIFPLRAKGIHFGRSEHDPRLQVADLLASAGAHWMSGFVSPSGDQDFLLQMKSSDIARFALDAVWPTPDISPKELGTQYEGGVNAAEAMAEFLAKHRRDS